MPNLGRPTRPNAIINANDTYCDAALLQVQSHGERFAHKHIRIVAACECPLQFLQLPRIEIRTGTATL